MIAAKDWPQVPLSQFLTLADASREERLEPDKKYALLGARWYAKGLYTKAIKTGNEIKASRLYRVQAGDFVYNRLFAWKGSFAVASEENDGCFVSNEFPSFVVNRERTVPEFLWYYFSREESWNRAFGLSTGATPTSRNRLKEASLLAMTIPLPSLDEQRWIVAKLDRLSAKISEARRLKGQAGNQANLLPVAMAHRTDLSREIKEATGWKDVKLSDVIKPDFDDRLVVGTEEYPNFGIYSYGRGLFAKTPIRGLETSATRLRRVRTGQFIYSRLFAWEGAFGLVTSEFDGWFVSGEYPTFSCDTSQILPEFLFAYFKAEQVWMSIAAGSKGLGSRRQRVQPDQILAHHLLLPPMDIQLKIKKVFARAPEIEESRDASAKEMEAMLPAILDRAFKGAL